MHYMQRSKLGGDVTGGGSRGQGTWLEVMWHVVGGKRRKIHVREKEMRLEAGGVEMLWREERVPEQNLYLQGSLGLLS